MITINGKEIENKYKTLGEYLTTSGYNVSRIAVELNGEIAPKGKYGEIPLKDGDKLEVVSFMGGG